MVLRHKIFYKFLVALLLNSSVCFSDEKTCSDFVDSASKSSLTKLAENSPSKLPPLFRIKHEDFLETGVNGIYYLNPANGKWKASSEQGVQILQDSQQSSVETAITFRVGLDSNSSTSKTIKAKYERVDPNEVGSNDLFFGTTRVKIRASSSDPSQTHSLVIEGYYLTKPEAIVISFQAPKAPTDIYIDIPIALPKVSMGIHTSFKWDNDKIETFDLTIHGPIIFEREIKMSIPNTNKSEALMHFQSFPWGDKSNRFQNQLLKRILENLFDPNVLERTLGIAAQGPEAIQKALQEVYYGIRPVNFHNKIKRSNDFFQSPSLVSTHVKEWEPGVPIERSEFAKEHGSYSHALQLIAMTSGMSRDQIYGFYFGPYRMFFQNRVGGWRVWDILFDAPGDSTPHSPLWWRREMELRGIQVD